MSPFSSLLIATTLVASTSTSRPVSEFAPHTDSNWSTFTCFDGNELSELMGDEYRFAIGQMGKGIDLLFDDEGLSSLAAAIIMRELMGYNISLSSYSHFNPIDIITNSSHIASALEVYPNYLDSHDNTVQNALFIDQPLGVQSLTSWYITHTFIDYIRARSNTTTHDQLWPDFWRTYTLKHISDELLSVGDMERLNISINNDECTSCNMLFVSDTTYDLSLNTQLIRAYNLSASLSIQYLDPEQRNAFIERDDFVLFSFRSPSTMVNSNHFERISLPSHANGISMINIHKFIPSALQIISRFGFDFVSSLKMSNTDYNRIYKSIYNEIGIDNVLMEDSNLRLNAVCDWLKSSATQWMSWIPEVTPYESINCALYSDEELSNLRYHETDYNKLPFTDSWTAQRVATQCIASAPNYPTSLLAVQIVSGVVLFAIFICVILVFLCRRQVIIIAASYPLLLSFLFGAAIGCVVPMLGFPKALYYVCEILCVHTSIILMFGSLIGKSWRLQLIIANAKKGKKTHVTTRYIMLRILSVCGLMCVYWCIVMMQCTQIETVRDIVAGVEYLRIKMENDKVFTLIALIFEFVFVLWGASIAWSLRSVNPQFNESKHIALILYHTLFVVLLIAILFVLPINPHMLRLLWMAVWLVMIAFAVSVLIVPKLRAIYHGVEYFEKGLVPKRTDSEAMAAIGNWIPKQLKTEEIQQLVKILRKLGFKVHRNSKRNQSSPNIFKRSRSNYEDEHSNNNHQYTQSARLHIEDMKRVSNQSVDSVVIHVNASKANEEETHCHHHARNTVLGLPPPSAWDYEDEEEEEEGLNSNDVRHTVTVANLVPPPLPSHIRKQFDFKKNTHQRSVTVPYPMPPIPIHAHAVCDSVSPSDGMMDIDDYASHDELPPQPPHMSQTVSTASCGSTKVSDIIAKFNYIHVTGGAPITPITNREYMD